MQLNLPHIQSSWKKALDPLSRMEHLLKTHEQKCIIHQLRGNLNNAADVLHLSLFYMINIQLNYSRREMYSLNLCVSDRKIML